MFSKAKKLFASDKLVLVAELPNGQKYVFNRDIFVTFFGNLTTRPFGMTPIRAAKRLVNRVSVFADASFQVVQSRALGTKVYIVFWFPEVDEFQLENWVGQVADLNNKELVTERHRRVIETAWEKAQSLEDCRKVA